MTVYTDKSIKVIRGFKTEQKARKAANEYGIINYMIKPDKGEWTIRYWDKKDYVINPTG